MPKRWGLQEGAAKLPMPHLHVRIVNYAIDADFLANGVDGVQIVKQHVKTIKNLQNTIRCPS